MTIQWDELRTAYDAWRAERDKFDRWMTAIAAGEPYDKAELRRDIEELDARHQVFLEKARPFVEPTA
jgi:hypothetical protein